MATFKQTLRANCLGASTPLLSPRLARLSLSMGCGSSTHEPGSPAAAQGHTIQPAPVHASGGGGQDKGDDKQSDVPHAAMAAAGSSEGGAAAASAPASDGLSARDSDKHRSKEKRSKGSTEERYEIIKVLGEGASCKVVSARDKATQVHNGGRPSTAPGSSRPVIITCAQCCSLSLPLSCLLVLVCSNFTL